MTGIVIFLCVIVSFILFYAGYFVGVRYVTHKFSTAFVDALFDSNVDRDTVKKVIARTEELVKKSVNED